ncbi:hypothetical protein BKA62DRAFT_699807 [Auriculariales sp. MPI-PUGE-AT-0066]|nr:hypothetical protein BKA62DRAFT_699807 [Auriculariales sp. MPI-PUGE-AT-0066]
MSQPAQATDYDGQMSSWALSPLSDLPTVQRKIACHFCRLRKLRCDGARPICNNCSRRKCQCNYDHAHKKRGPDRTRRRARRRPSEGNGEGPSDTNGEGPSDTNGEGPSDTNGEGTGEAAPENDDDPTPAP